MDPDFPDLDLSPILSKPTKKRNFLETRNKNKLNLEDVYKQLQQYLKKGESIPKDELKVYLEQTKNINSDDPKNHRLLTKIRGLLNSIQKKRSDFQCSFVEGQMTMYERSASEQIAGSSSILEPQEFYSQPNNDSFNLPSNFLTNDNFITPSSDQKPTSMEVESSYNYSQDLFPDTIESLYALSQENYKMLKGLTNNTEPGTNEDSDFVFKVPKTEKFDKVYKVHEAVEERYNSLVSLTPSLPKTSSQEDATCDINMGSFQDTQSQSFTFNNFDDLSITNDELKQEFDKLLENTENWVSDIVNNLIYLQVNDNHNSLNILNENSGNISSDNEIDTNASSVAIATQHSEENLKILREVCSEFKKNLEEEMKSNKKLEIFKELLNSSDLSSIE